MWRLLILLLLVGCGSARRGLLVSGPVALDRHEERGQRAFAEYCYECHPDGTAGLGPAINNRPLPRWFIKMQVRAGLGGMPSFDEAMVSDEELDAIADYLVALRNADDGG